MDYRKTLNLPKMSLPAKDYSAETELEILEFWRTLQVYESRQKSNKEKSVFFVQNPPRSAYGDVCIEDALNMILQDMVVKYKLMRGFNVPYFPSWDCYTSAIELEALNLLSSKRNEVSPSEVRKQCRRLTSEYISLQKNQFQKLGIFAYWDKAILTSGSRYKSRMIEVFGSLYEAGYLQKDSKPTLWCIDCQNDLVETEVEYRDFNLLSLLVKFPVIHGLEELGEDVFMVVSTSTPWTLPANTAIVVHPTLDYVAVQSEKNEILIMAASAIDDTLGKKARRKYRIVRQMKGLDLDKIVYAHPFLDRNSDVLLSKSITLTRGTGCVHSASKHNQDIISTVDQNGRLTEDAGQFCGLNVFEASDMISLELEKRGCLLASKPVKHPYPHCSYCKKPVIVRSADKWVFNLNANDLRRRALKGIDEVNWLPGWCKNNTSDNIINRSDLSISRRRIWGIPAPVFYCKKCNTQFNIPESISASLKMISKKGFSRWLTAKPDDILADDVTCNRCGGRNLRWETEMLDPEFVSAMTYKGIFSENKDLWPLVDICMGSDGRNEKWLQFSFLSSMAIDESPPFKSVVVHGAVVDENGKRISDSTDGAPSVQDIVNEYGADVLRLWAISMDCGKRLRISQPQLKIVSKAHKRIKNVCRFMLGNLPGFDPVRDKVVYDYLQEIDRWILHKLAKLVDNITKALESSQFHSFYRLLYHFCSLDLGTLYLSVVKRRLYAFPEWSIGRRAVQTALYEVLINIAKLMAPVLPFTAEEVWRHIPHIVEKYPSVYLASWPSVDREFLDDELETRWNRLLKVRTQINRLLEKIRQEGLIERFSQAYVILYVSSPEVYKLLEKYIDDFETIFMVSKVRLMPLDTTVPDGIFESNEVIGLAIEARRATGEKCERCWIYSDTVGTNEQHPTLCHRCIDILEGGTYYI